MPNNAELIDHLMIPIDDVLWPSIIAKLNQATTDVGCATKIEVAIIVRIIDTLIASVRDMKAIGKKYTPREFFDRAEEELYAKVKKCP